MKILLLLFLCNSAYAQHCVFDGSYAVVVKLVTKSGKPRGLGSYTITLNEKIFDNADTCCIVNATFDSSKKVLLYTDRDAWNLSSKHFKDAPMFKDGTYAVKLYNADVKCLFNECNTEQKIRITYTYKRYKIKRYAYISRDDVYGLCKASGNWYRIKPVVITVPDEEQFYGH